MQGRILDIDRQAGRALVLGGDGVRYAFPLSEWRAPDPPIPGLPVDFVAEGSEARAVFPLPPQFSAAPGYGPMPAYLPPGATVPGDNSVTLGGIGVFCLALSFVIPLLPVIAAFVLGLIGAGMAKRFGNSTGLLLSRIAWIGALVLTALGIAMLVAGATFFFAVFGPLFNELMQGNWTTV